MDKVGSAIIDFTEAAYDLELDDQEWLPTMLKRGLPVLDRGIAVAGMVYGRPPDGGDFQLLEVHQASGPEDFAERHAHALATTPPEVLREQVRPGCAGTASQDVNADLEQIAHYTAHLPYCKDILYMTAVNAKGAGVAVVTLLPEITALTDRQAERWQMLAAHLDAGHRLRQGLAATESDDETITGLPHGAEAVLDPTGFRVTDASGKAQSSRAGAKLREAAVTVDRARGQLRKTDPDAALELWKALVHGRWSMVDWFDTDGRRFVLALPNARNVTDPRGLTEREGQVVGYVVLGHTNKMVGYNLGISLSHVSVLLRSAMRKLGVRTRAQLVKNLRDLQALQ